MSHVERGSKLLTDRDIQFNTACAHRTSNNLPLAIDMAESLWNHSYHTPGSALLIGNLALDCGNYLESLGWHTTAYRLANISTSISPSDLAQCALALAYSRMRLGEWNPYTWELWEQGRNHKSWDLVDGTDPWTHADIHSPALILSEGGYGDAFLYSRFLSLIPTLSRVSSKLVFGPNFRLLHNFPYSWEDTPTLHAHDFLNWSAFRYSTALMSLPSIFRVGSTVDIPSHTPLDIPNLSRYTGARMGLCWRAEENGVPKRIRSVDNVEELKPLSRWDWVSLNPSAIPPFPSCQRRDLRSWLDTATLIASLDLVVTVDTAVAHLSGLLGVPTLVLLPLAVDWKWGVEGKDSYWWPSHTLIRNSSPYNWTDAISQVVDYLERR